MPDQAMNRRTEIEPEALTVGESTEFTRTSRTVIYGAMARGELKYLKVGKRRLLRIAELRRWISSFERYGAA